MTKDAELPDRCVKCNAPANGYRLKRNLSWHPPVWYFLILISLLVYIIVALVIRHTAKIQVGLCEEHRRQRRWAIALGWIGSLAGIGLIAFSASLQDTQWFPIGLVLGLLFFFGFLIYGISVSQVVAPKKIDKRFVWLKKVSPDLLAKLPDWNVGKGPSLSDPLL